MTKSYNYTPTHFLYSSLLFFLLIFMHQQTYCHTLSKPLSQIFLFRIYAPTTHAIDLDPDETSVPVSTNTHTHTTPQTNPPTTTDTHPQIPHPQTPTNPTPTQIPHPYSPTSTQPHKHTAPHHTPTHAPQTDAGPTDVDVDAASMSSQPRLSPFRASDRPSTGSDQTRSGQAIDPASDETSRPVSANFSPKPDSRLIRDAIRADAVVDVDAPMQIQVPACWEADWTQV